MARKQRIWAEMLVTKAQRLREPLWWYPFPALLPFGLAMTLTAHLVFSTTTRLGHPAGVVAFPSEPRPDGPIWFTVTPVDGDIVVTTGDRKVFRWRQDSRSYKASSDFSRYLEEHVKLQVEAAALAMRATEQQSVAVIAADQHLRYLHMRPILYALAEAGITRYAFETQIPGRSEKSAGPEHAGGHAQASPPAEDAPL